MKKVILYNSDDYSPILNEELAQEIRQQYIKDNPHKKMTLKELDDVVAENLDSLEYEQYNEVIDRIHKGLDGVSLLISTDNHTNRSLDIWQNLDFKDVMETLMDSHHPSTINNVTIGIDETGTLFVDISSGNALTPTRAKVKNLTPLASKILDSFESNLDARDEENYEAFKSLNKHFDGQFFDNDLFKIFLENPKYTQNVKVDDVDYEDIEFKKKPELSDDDYKDAIRLFPVKKALDLYADSAHGWLKVPFKDLDELNIARDISKCSCEKGEFVYLEEDCDATLYLDAQRAQGFNIKINWHDSDRSSKIRNYDSYSFGNSEPLENARQRRKEFFDKAKIIVDALVEAEVFVFDDNGKIAYAEGQSADNLKDIYKNTSFYAGIFCNDVISKLPKEQLNDENPNKVRKQQ